MNACQLVIALAVLGMSDGVARADELLTYELDASVSEGLDLTAMPGYHADRVRGPKSANITFAGPLTVSSSVSAENPFTIYGQGKRLETGAASSGLVSTPVRLVNAPGVTDTSSLKLGKDTKLYMSAIEVGAHNQLEFDWVGTGNMAFNGLTRLDVQEGGCVKNGFGLIFGVDTNLEVRVTGGSSIAAEYYIDLGSQTKALGFAMKAHMVVSNSTVSSKSADPNNNKCFCMMDGVAAPDSETENCRIDLQRDGVLNVALLMHGGGGRSNVNFDGGRLFSPAETGQPLFYAKGWTYAGSAPSPHMYLQGVNGHPIDIQIDHDRTLSGGYTPSRLVNVTGTGGFTKRGAGVLTFNRLDMSVCDYTGPTEILGGGIVVVNSGYKPGRGSLTVSAGSFLDLNGLMCEFESASGAGVITNGGSAAELRLGYGDATGVFELATVGSPVRIVKSGTGTLTVGRAALQNACDLAIDAGIVKFTGDSSSYGTVKVAAGATLDVRGISFSCANLALLSAESKILTDEDTTLLISSDADGDFNNGLVGLSGNFCKGGVGTMTLYGAEKITGSVDIRAGTLKVLPGKWFGKYFKLNMEKGQSTDSSQWHKRLGEFALYDANGVNVARSITVFNETQSDVGTGLAGGEMRLGRNGTASDGWYQYPQDSGPLNLFDGQDATVLDLQSGWGKEFVILRLPDSSDEIVGYNFNNGFGSFRLVTWNLYGSVDGQNWTLLGRHSCSDWNDMEERQRVTDETPNDDQAWYNGGLPYCFSSYSNRTGRVFGEDAVIHVAAGAELDVCDIGLELSRLQVDYTQQGNGLITRFTPAVNGILMLVNVNLPELKAGEHKLPLAVGDIGQPANFRTWRVYVDGVLCEDLRVRYRNGFLYVVPKQGLMLILASL